MTRLDTDSPFNGKNLIGKRFIRLLVLAYAGKDKSRDAYWKCECDCGVIMVASGHSMKAGTTKSCGCYGLEVALAAMQRGRKRHGYASAGNQDANYTTWCTMIQRCTNPNNTKFPSYGGRGIKVCERWLDFQNFINDIGPKPDPSLSLERRDNNGDYCPENCRWATRKEQGRNRRDNHFLDFRGKRATLAEWSEIAGLKYDTLKRRINKLKWPVEKAITQPSRYAKT